jgi:hypothetical protein
MILMPFIIDHIKAPRSLHNQCKLLTKQLNGLTTVYFNGAVGYSEAIRLNNRRLSDEGELFIAKY